jgi:hypothetical protein
MYIENARELGNLDDRPVFPSDVEIHTVNLV